VNQVDALTVQQNGSRHSMSDLVVTLSGADASTWQAWQKGKGGGKTGQLEYLTADLRGALFSLTFHNLELKRLTTDSSQARNSIRRVKAEMGFQGVIFSYGGALA
jgi:hypothetical protein